jgi:hypothetical protein
MVVVMVMMMMVPGVQDDPRDIDPWTMMVMMMVVMVMMMAISGKPDIALLHLTGRLLLRARRIIGAEHGESVRNRLQKVAV